MCIEPYTNPQDLSKKKLGYAFCLEFLEEDRSRIDKIPFSKKIISKIF